MIPDTIVEPLDIEIDTECCSLLDSFDIDSFDIDSCWRQRKELVVEVCLMFYKEFQQDGFLFVAINNKM